MRNFSGKLRQTCRSVNLLVVLFVLVIFLAPLTYLRGADPYAINWVEGRRMTVFELRQRGFVTALKDYALGDPAPLRQVIDDQFIRRDMLVNIEKAAADQFPLRLAGIHIAKAVDRLSIRLAYDFTDDLAIPADMHSDIWVVRAAPVLIPEPERFNEATLGVIDDRISLYQTLLDAHPEINFYLYQIERIQNSEHHPMNAYFDGLDAGQYTQYFRAHKPAGLQMASLAINSFDDHLRYFYQTDHHLNAQGIMTAYHQIHALLQTHYPEISPVRTYNPFIQLLEVEFFGTAARMSFYPLKEAVFEVADYGLPPHRVYENGQEIIYGNSADYLAGNHPREAYFNHYEGYYGGDRGLIEFVFENQPARNLLVFGNSYDNALVPLIASHYRHTYSIDVRYYPGFSLSAFLAEHAVDDILVVGEDSVVFKSSRYQINP
jgi:hypothetical protein